MPLSTQTRQTIISDYKRHDGDTGSPEVQISLLTGRIMQLSEHLQDHKKDNHSRRGLVMMVAQRNKLLRYLARTDRDRYLALISKLGLRK